MHNYTRDDIFHIVEEEDVAFIRLQFTDIFGTMKNMAVTVGQLEKALDNRCMFDVSSLEGVADEEESDMYLYPDLDSFAIFPWNAGGNRVATAKRERGVPGATRSRSRPPAAHGRLGRPRGTQRDPG